MSDRAAMHPLRGAVLALIVVFVAGCDREDAGPGMAQQGGPAVAVPADVRATPSMPARFALGRAPAKAELAAWDIDVGPDGAGLPPGRGTYAEGAKLYAAKCAACHGARGEGMGQGLVSYPKLIGREPREGFPFGADAKYVKTVGNYWPYATTLFDYVRRAMPLTQPGSLRNDEVTLRIAGARHVEAYRRAFLHVWRLTPR